MRTEWQRRLWAVMCALCVIVVTIPAIADEKDDEYYELMKTFVDTFEQIERNYVKDVDRRELLEAAIRGMLGELDQYSSYITPEDLARFNQQVEQEFGGIGIQVHVDPMTKRLTVMTPLPGTPAYREGIRAGDVIMEIEGKSTEGFTLDNAVKLLKGKAGEAVTIGVKPLGSNEIKQVTVVRDVIQVSTVLGDRYKPDGAWEYFVDDEHKIGYIRLTHFSRRSADEMRHALEQLQEAGMQGLILDLRFNPGGLLSQATEISDLFVDEGTIVSTKGRNTRERTWTAQKEGTFTGFPMVVLVNRYSASASEIVSACLQDHGRAKVIGERTWGKGSVQNVIELESGQSALKLTTASYHRPSGKNIHRFDGATDEDDWGVMPEEDDLLKYSTDELQEYLEYRRQRDVLKDDGPPEADFQDRQIQRALKHLRAEITGETESDAEKTESKQETDSEENAAQKDDPDKEDSNKEQDGKNEADEPSSPQDDADADEDGEASVPGNRPASVRLLKTRAV